MPGTKTLCCQDLTTWWSMETLSTSSATTSSAVDRGSFASAGRSRCRRSHGVRPHCSFATVAAPGLPTVALTAAV
eukprot:scaffold7524_cov713-Prasinococcus_capsulatus_cf.AAC.1